MTEVNEKTTFVLLLVFWGCGNCGAVVEPPASPLEESAFVTSSLIKDWVASAGASLSDYDLVF